MKLGFAKIMIYDIETKRISYYTGNLEEISKDYYKITTYKGEEMLFRREQVKRIFPIGGPGSFNTLKEDGHGKKQS